MKHPTLRKGGVVWKALTSFLLLVVDSSAISADTLSLAFDFGVSIWMDNVRILVARTPRPVSEPAVPYRLVISLPLLPLWRLGKISFLSMS